AGSLPTGRRASLSAIGSSLEPQPCPGSVRRRAHAQRVHVARTGWMTGSFLAYGGALTALIAAVAWLGVISDDHGQGAFAGWSVLFWALAEVLAFALLGRGHRVLAGLFGFVGLGLFALMIGAFFSWFG